MANINISNQGANALSEDVMARLPARQRLYLEYKPKLKDLVQKYPRISYHIDDTALAASAGDILDKVGFMTMSQPVSQIGRSLVQYLMSWLKNGDLVLLHIRPQPSGATLIDLLRELKRKAPFILNIGLLPIFMGAVTSTKQRDLFRLLGQFGIRYAIFLDPAAPFDTNIEILLKDLHEFSNLLRKDFGGGEEPVATGEAAMVDTGVVKKYRELLAEGEALMRQGNPEAAIKFFTQAIELKPEFNSMMKRGDAFYKNRQFVPALNDYREANRLEQTKAEPYARVGACCFQMLKDPENRKNPESAKKVFNLGIKYLGEATRMIEKMESDNSHLPEKLPPEPYGPLMAALVDADVRGIGIGSEEEQLKDIMAKVLSHTKYIDADHSEVDVDMRIDKAILLTRNGYYDEAERIFRDIIQRDIQNVGPAFNNFAVELRKNGQYGKSFEIYMELLRYEVPDRNIVLENFKTAGRRYAASLRDEMKQDEAIAVYKNILMQISKSKGREWILCDIAMTYLEQQDQAQASFRLMEAIYINPNLMESEEFMKNYKDLINLRKEMMKKLAQGAL